MWINSIETAVSLCAADYLRKTMAVMLTQLDEVMNGMLTCNKACYISEDLCMCDTETVYSRVFVRKLILIWLIKKFPTHYRTWRFMTVFTGVHHSFLSFTRLAHSTPYGIRSYRYLPSVSSLLLHNLTVHLVFMDYFVVWTWNLVFNLKTNTCIRGVRENILIWDGGKKRLMEKLPHEELHIWYACG